MVVAYACDRPITLGRNVPQMLDLSSEKRDNSGDVGRKLRRASSVPKAITNPILASEPSMLLLSIGVHD